MLGEKSRYKAEVLQLKARLAGKLKEGKDKGTRIDITMLDLGQWGPRLMR